MAEDQVSVPHMPEAAVNLAQSIPLEVESEQGFDESSDLSMTSTPMPSRIAIVQSFSPELSGDGISDAAAAESSQQDNRMELEEARRDAEVSAHALENLVEGMRAIKRILERTTSEQDTSPGNTDEDFKRIHELSEQLHGVLGSDLMGLANAANMIREHTRLAAVETSDLIADVHAARAEAQESAIRAKQAKKVGRQLLNENIDLRGQVKRLTQERKALVKEVKSLRQDAEETRKFDSWRLLEQHVLGSMAIHERVMKTPGTPKTPIVDTTIEETPSVCVANAQSETSLQGAGQPESQTPRDRGIGNMLRGFRRRALRAQEQTPGNNRDVDQTPEPQIQSPPRLGSKSPIPSLGEASTFSEDSGIPGHVPEKENGALPNNVQFDNLARVNDFPRHLASPLVSPDGTPEGVSTPDYKPICDPNILRTLAIPSSEKPCVDYTQSSPGKDVMGDLYEC